MGALAGDAYPDAGGVVVFVEPYHVPLLAVERIVAGQGVGVGRDFQVDGGGVDGGVVVIVGSALRVYRDNAVPAAFVLLEAELAAL